MDPLVELQGITVTFPGVKALDEVDFRLLPGEVHALLGENGAGKSTLIKALTGVHATDAGEIRLAGVPVSFHGPAQAQDAGISTVYQEVNLCVNLSVAENILLGREPRRFGAIDGRAMRARAAELLSRIGLHIDPGSALGSHPIAVQQLVAIARAVAAGARVLILDEPTSSLDIHETAMLFDVMRKLPLASEIVSHARQELVRRLDSYQVEKPELMQSVVNFIEDKIMPIIVRHAISGRADINSEEKLFHDPHALAMFIDIFSERGFHATVDLHLIEIPERFDLQTGEIHCRKKKVFRFNIRFKGSEIRRG